MFSFHTSFCSLRRLEQRKGKIMLTSLELPGERNVQNEEDAGLQTGLSSGQMLQHGLVVNPCCGLLGLRGEATL